MKINETFEEWWEKDDYTTRICDADNHLIPHTETPSFLGECWNHQKAKIDRLVECVRDFNNARLGFTRDRQEVEKKLAELIAEVIE